MLVGKLYSGQISTHPEAGFAFWLEEVLEDVGVLVTGHVGVGGAVRVIPGVGQGVGLSF